MILVRHRRLPPANLAVDDVHMQDYFTDSALIVCTSRRKEHTMEGICYFSCFGNNHRALRTTSLLLMANIEMHVWVEFGLVG